MFEAIKLTAEQIDALSNPDSDWLKLTDEHHELIRTCGPERTCAFIGDALVRMSRDQFLRMMNAAFQVGLRSAAKELGIGSMHEVLHFDFEEVKDCDAYLTVTVTSLDGRKASGLGQLVLPSVAN